MGTVALILGIASLVGTLVGVYTNNQNNKFIDETNEKNRQFQEETNLQNHQWSLEAAQWEYEHEKPQRQYSDLLSAGLTPAAAAQKISGANVSYSPATAVAPQNMPKSTSMLNDSLQQVVSDIGNYSSMSQAEASAAKSRAETQVISETGVKRANAEIGKILSDTLVSYSQKNVADSQVDLNNANTALTNEKINSEQLTQQSIVSNTSLTNEKINTEQLTQQSIKLSNDEREIQLEFTRKTLDMSVQKTQAEIKYLSEQTAKLKEEINGINFDNAYKSWVNTYIDTYGVSPEQGWQDMFYKAIADGKADVLLDSFSESLRKVFDNDGNLHTLPYHNRWWRKPRPTQYSPINESLQLR